MNCEFLKILAESRSMEFDISPVKCDTSLQFDGELASKISKHTDIFSIPIIGINFRYERICADNYGDYFLNISLINQRYNSNWKRKFLHLGDYYKIRCIEYTGDIDVSKPESYIHLPFITENDVYFLKNNTTCKYVRLLLINKSCADLDDGENHLLDESYYFHLTNKDIANILKSNFCLNCTKLSSCGIVDFKSKIIFRKDKIIGDEISGDVYIPIFRSDNYEYMEGGKYLYIDFSRREDIKTEEEIFIKNNYKWLLVKIVFCKNDNYDRGYNADSSKEIGLLIRIDDNNLPLNKNAIRLMKSFSPFFTRNKYLSGVLGKIKGDCYSFITLLDKTCSYEDGVYHRYSRPIGRCFFETSINITKLKESDIVPAEEIGEFNEAIGQYNLFPDVYSIAVRIKFLLGLLANKESNRNKKKIIILRKRKFSNILKVLNKKKSDLINRQFLDSHPVNLEFSKKKLSNKFKNEKIYLSKVYTSLYN